MRKDSIICCKKLITNTPFAEINGGWAIWGIPTSIDWWKVQENEYIESLVKYRHNKEAGGSTCFATLVSAALEEVSIWIESGVKVKGRSWLDIGGGNGYYAIALKLLGAKHVKLIDVEAPSKYATPVLRSLNIESIVKDGRDIFSNDVDSIVLLYVPLLGIADVFANYPGIFQAVIDVDCFDERFLKISNWGRNSFFEKEKLFRLGCGGAVFESQGNGCLDYNWINGNVITNSKYIQELLQAGINELEHQGDEIEGYNHELKRNLRVELKAETTLSDVPF